MAGRQTSPPHQTTTRRLHCGDNIEVLHGQPAGSVHLVYLDPPFNSGRDWYTQPRARGGSAQVLAFSDRWTWSEDAAQQYKQLIAAGDPQSAAMDWFREILGESGALAYLLHMAARLAELHRVLAETGGIFLHCDDRMSHYLQILLDQVFGCANFCDKIIWKRSSAHTTTRGLARVHDTILIYQRSGRAAWAGPDGLLMQRLGERGTVWTDIPPVNARARERLGWPTQKPLPLLTRIITLTGRPGQTLLDPYCGCGTSIEAAQRAGLGWIGIDVSLDAIALTQARLQAAGADFEVHGAPAITPKPGTLF